MRIDRITPIDRITRIDRIMRGHEIGHRRIATSLNSPHQNDANDNAETQSNSQCARDHEQPFGAVGMTKLARTEDIRVVLNPKRSTLDETSKQSQMTSNALTADPPGVVLRGSIGRIDEEGRRQIVSLLSHIVH